MYRRPARVPSTLIQWRSVCAAFFFQAEDGIRGHCVTGVQTCALPISRGLEALSIVLPDVRLLEVSEHLLEENALGTGDATVYLQITRGVAERRHHFPPPGTAPTVFLSASRLVVPDELRARGAAAVTTADLRWERCDLKTVNLLPNVLAKQQAVAAGAFEALLVRDGIVTEGASSNLFAVIAGKLHTHPPTHRILAGITREVVLELAAELAIPVVLEPI